jgi:hypothetical protein
VWGVLTLALGVFLWFRDPPRRPPTTARFRLRSRARRSPQKRREPIFYPANRRDAMTKLCSLTEAVARFVQDGDSVYLAGFTHLIPFAAGHEIIRQGRKDLTLARATPDLIYDQMVAAGCARKVIFSYMGNPGVGSLRACARPSKPGSWNGKNTRTLA